MCILIVDDDPGIRELVGLFLAHKGYDSVQTRNGSEALTCLQQDETLPDLILLDLMMPIMDGAEFRQAQLHEPKLAEIPVVVMSAAENIETQAPTLTANAYLPKPIDFDTLSRLVEQYCGRGRQQGG
jgi:CheY-like chemotaxis protein